jgi:hypothetical protein
MVQFVNVIGDQTVAANRLLSPENASLSLVYMQQQKPIVPAELNYMQQIGNEGRRLLAANVSRPGFFTRDAFTASGTALVIPESWANVNGEVLHVATGLGTTGSPYGAVTLPLSPPPGSGNAYDVVFLELWYAEVSVIGAPDAASENLWANGQVGAATDLASQVNYAIKEPLVTSVSETTRRIQMRWRLRVFNSTVAPVGEGLTASGAYTVAPGAMADSGVNNGGFPFSALAGAINSGLYRAGDGAISTTTTFKDATGYVYAIPIAIVAHTAGEGNLNVATQVTDKRHAASPLGIVGDESPNVTLAGDDIIFRKRDNVTEIGRLIGSSTPFRFQTNQFVSLATTGTAPLVVTSTTKVVNFNAHYLDVSGTPTAPGNSSGLIPLSNGTVNTNLNADMVDGTHVGTAPGNLVPLDPTGTYAGKINPNYLPTAAPLTTVDSLSESRVGGIYTGSGPSGSHPSNDFLLKTEISQMGVSGSGINAAQNAQYATSAGTANSAGSALSVPLSGVQGAKNSAGITADTAATPNTIVLRNATGGTALGQITGTLVGTATNANTLTRAAGGAVNTNPEPLNFPTGFLLPIMTVDNLTPINGTANAWVQPNNKGATSGTNVPNLYQFPLKPSRFRLGAGIPVHCKIFGTVYRNGVGGPAPAATYGFRIIAPGGTVVYSALVSLSSGGGAIPAGSYAAFNLQDQAGAVFTVATDGSQDGMWDIQIYSSNVMVNNYNVGNIYLEVYAFGPNSLGAS